MRDTVCNPKEEPGMEKIHHDLFSIIPGINHASTVPVLDADTLTEEEFITNWVFPNKPCLIKGAVKHWPAVQKWKDHEYWLSICENFNIQVHLHQNYNSPDLQVGEEMTFYDAVERLFQNRDYIVSMPSEAVREGGRFASLLNDIKGFKFLTRSKMPRVYDRSRLFSYRRAATAWHYHPVDETLMCQVNGSKRVALLPENIPNAKYVIKFLREERHLRGEVMDKSLDLSPAIVDVDEGDALYIPPYWHHGVVPNDGKVGFTLAYCWSSPWHKFGNLTSYFVRKLYRDAMWPFKSISLFLPFIACYSFVLYLFEKSKRRHETNVLPEL